MALVGSPNSGKTTLFNWLTGLRYSTVNYPGSTVDYSMGTSHDRYGDPVRLMDTPGVYSLFPKSLDEEVAVKALHQHPEFGSAELVLSVADATQLARHLLVTRQLVESGFKVILAVTMVDLLREQGKELDATALSQELGCPVVAIDGRLGGGVLELMAEVRKALGRELSELKPQRLAHWQAEKTESVIRESDQLARKVLKASGTEVRSKRDAAARTELLDRFFLHPFFGLALFLGIMTGLFTSIYWLAQPFMDGIDEGFSYLADVVLQAGGGALWADFVANGVIASFGAVLVFVPQIFILFLGITFLEESGYLARAATMMDKPFSKIGLSGRSFVPLLSAHACAVPAMMAARSIGGRKERLLTLFIVPLMSCSARLPVYALLLLFLFYSQPAWIAGLVLAGIYFAALLVGAVAAAVGNRMLNIQEKPFFLMELPVYRRPVVQAVLRRAYDRTASYVRRAGPVIFVLALIVWAGTTFPNYASEDDGQKLSQSYAGQLGQAIEPVFSPMGADWRVGIGLISAFAAREVFVSSLAVVFSVADDDEDTMRGSLVARMSEAKHSDGSPLFTFASVMGLIVFFMIALQCLSTTAVASKEAGSWKFALVQLVAFNLLGYLAAVVVVNGLRAMGIA
ncbi:MAG: ferrous iron transporter B [Bdellovibrionaceae bacterium]|nr:ferrous iron transporter B [Bdellovibrionales bacterium]MCB9084445.1 ferrous iron transporter B [Pseudobdellovibrionaceae bacterium]